MNPTAVAQHTTSALQRTRRSFLCTASGASAAWIEASIPAANVKTVDEKLDAYLKNADFFDVEKFPTLTFKSTTIRSEGGRDYSVTADMTIHGVTRSVTLNVKDVSKLANDPWGNLRIGLSASVKVNRKDFGIIWNTALDSGAS
jgi:polyisoprenoid-binding protein YceI